MTSQVVFKMDTKLKERAMKKARNEGLAFSSVLNFAAKAYVDGKMDIGVYMPPKFNAKTRKEIEEALEDIKHGRNLSPGFTSAKDAIAYLKSL